MNKTKLKEWVDNHKAELVIAGCTAVAGGIIAVLIGKKTSSIPVKFVALDDSSEAMLKDLNKMDPKAEALGWSLGVAVNLWKEGYYTNLLVNDITLADCGKLGEECLKLGDFKPETTVSVIMGLL